MNGIGRKLHSGKSLNARLVWYRPGARMRWHAHAHHQVSWLLVGELQESGRRMDKSICVPSVGFKPAGFNHENTFGATGALILSVNIAPGFDGDWLRQVRDDWCWSPQQANAPVVGALARMAASSGSCGEEAVFDLLALSIDHPLRRIGQPPHWLLQVKDRLGDPHDNRRLAEIANDAGVHRVHMSRMFSRAFGIPPSLYRAQCRLARGVEAVVGGASPAQAAHAAGFADQPHFTRSALRTLGLPPGRLGDLFRGH